MADNQGLGRLSTDPWKLTLPAMAVHAGVQLLRGGTVGRIVGAAPRGCSDNPPDGPSPQQLHTRMDRHRRKGQLPWVGTQSTKPLVIRHHSGDTLPVQRGSTLRSSASSSARGATTQLRGASSVMNRPWWIDCSTTSCFRVPFPGAPVLG